EPVIAGNRIGDESLDAGIADVLESLPVRRVHVGVVRIETSRSPADRPDGGEVGIIRREFRALLEGKSREPTAKLGDLERGVLGCDIDLKVAPGSPHQRRKY